MGKRWNDNDMSGLYDLQPAAQVQCDIIPAARPECDVRGKMADVYSVRQFGEDHLLFQLDDTRVHEASSI